MAIEVRAVVEIANLRSTWLCPFCGTEGKINRTCKCGAGIYGRGNGRFVAKRTDRKGALSLKEEQEAQLKFNSTIRKK